MPLLRTDRQSSVFTHRLCYRELLPHAGRPSTFHTAAAPLADLAAAPSQQMLPAAPRILLQAASLDCWRHIAAANRLIVIPPFIRILQHTRPATPASLVPA